MSVWRSWLGFFQLVFCAMFSEVCFVAADVKPVRPQSVISPRVYGNKSDVFCETPTLPRGSIHIVIAGHASNTCFQHYVWDMGVSNANVFVYRRENLGQPPRTWKGACGVIVQEKILAPNWGRDGGAFYDYAIEFYSKPPDVVVFLHGHGGFASHTSCEAIFSRVHMFYQSHAKADFLGFSEHMVSLTSFSDGSGDITTWYGGRRRSLYNIFGPWFNTIVATEAPVADPKKEEETPEQKGCTVVLNRWGIRVPSTATYTADTFENCCASFILPGKRLLMHPRGLYEDLRAFVMSENLSDQLTGRFCFEFIVYRLFKEPQLSQDMKDFYALPVPPSVLDRLSGCKNTSLYEQCH